MPYGLSEETFNSIVQVFASFSNIRRVRLFGSRALGRERPGSDIDLGLDGAGLNFEYLLDVRFKLDVLQLPYQFDLVSTETCNSVELVNHIERVGITIFER